MLAKPANKTDCKEQWDAVIKSSLDAEWNDALDEVLQQLAVMQDVAIFEAEKTVYAKEAIRVRLLKK